MRLGEFAVVFKSPLTGAIQLQWSEMVGDGEFSTVTGPGAASWSAVPGFENPTMHDILAKTTISVGLVASAAWTAFLAFEIFRLLVSYF